MFDKSKFAQILKNISDSYESQRDFSKKSGINRTYLSQYINMKLDKPPKPEILERLAKASKGITRYEELMIICDYLSDNSLNNEKLLKEYNNLNLLEEDYDKERFKQHLKELLTFSSEEYSIYLKLQTEVFHYAYDGVKLKEDDIFSLLSIYDFLSKNSKHKLVKSLMKFYNYEYQKRIIENNIKEAKELSNVDSDANSLNTSVKNYFYMAPVYGQISAGQPNWAEECIEGRIPLDYNMMNIVDPEECFFLRVNGESMNKVVRNGAYALIRKTDWVENGEIAVVLVNGYDATLKKFNKNGDVVVLEPMSNDSSFQTQIYTKETPIKILGKYIGKFEMK